MTTNITIELTLWPVAAGQDDDTAGHALTQGGSSSGTTAFHFTLPGPVRAFNPQPDPPMPPVEDVRGLLLSEQDNVGAAPAVAQNADDTAGYRVSAAPTRTLDFQWGRPVAIRVNLPDLGARCGIITEDKRADVQGFRMMEEMTKEEGQAGPRNPYGLLNGLAVVVGDVFLGGMKP